jgi:RNA polymerase sigma factor (sigma-70 family)
MNVNPNVWDAVEPQDTTAQPADAMKQGEARHLLAEALGQLNPVQKRVLLLRYYSDMPFGEIAKTLNCPLNTALSHCRRGLLALRKILAEDPL